MKEEQLQIDLAAVTKEALRDRQPGEDLDEALLRICKDLYGTKGLTAFQSVRNAVEAYATQRNLGLESALQEIAGGSSASNVTTFSKSFSMQKTATSLDDLPPEMREQVQKVLESGKSGQVVLTRTISGTEGLGSLLGLGLRLLLNSRKQPMDVTPPAPTTEPHASTQPRVTAKPGPTTQARIAPQPQMATQPGMVRCQNCKLAYSKERISCPGCGTERKRSFWARLFGN